MFFSRWESGKTYANIFPHIPFVLKRFLAAPRSAFKLYDYDGTGSISQPNLRKVPKQGGWEEICMFTLRKFIGSVKCLFLFFYGINTWYIYIYIQYVYLCTRVF